MTITKKHEHIWHNKIDWCQNHSKISFLENKVSGLTVSLGCTQGNQRTTFILKWNFGSQHMANK